MSLKERFAAARQRLAQPDVRRDLVGVAGVGLIAFGVWQYSHPAGFIVLGALLVVWAVLTAAGDA